MELHVGRDALAFPNNIIITTTLMKEDTKDIEFRERKPNYIF